MIVQYKNYEIQPEQGRYNLVKKVTRNKIDDNRKPTGETYIGEDTMAYGVTFDGAIKRIIEDLIAQNEETVDLHQFMKAYQNEVDLIYKALKHEHNS